MTAVDGVTHTEGQLAPDRDREPLVLAGAPTTKGGIYRQMPPSSATVLH
jgi:hypothetical protein